MSAYQPAPPGPFDEETLRRNLAEAERHYQEALRDYATAIDLRMGNDAIAQAEALKRAARMEYHRLLRIFSDWVVRGKRPKP